MSRKNHSPRPPGKPMRCPFCGYGSGIIDGIDYGIWTARVEHPKACPNCKGYLNRKVKVPGMGRMPIADPPEIDKFITSLSGSKTL